MSDDVYKFTDTWGDTISVGAAYRGEKIIGMVSRDGRDMAVTVPGYEVKKLIIALLGEDYKPHDMGET